MHPLSDIAKKFLEKRKLNIPFIGKDKPGQGQGQGQGKGQGQRKGTGEAAEELRQQQQQSQQSQSQQQNRQSGSGRRRRTSQQTQHFDFYLPSNMGKSNKFDCTNRRNEGVELGRSIGDAALKELEKSKKDATRIATKARKSSTGSRTGPDPDVVGVHYIDLIVPSKVLTDDGVAAMVEGLHSAMSRGTSEASIVVEGINLRDNKLTTRALAILAPVIDLAQNELKTLVLSENNITVNTDEEAKQWETFLKSFKSCKTLRRLDLSGNADLGTRALEIFSNIHCNEPAIDPIALGGDRSVFTMDETLENDETRSVPSDNYVSEEESFDPMTVGVFLKRRSGLRSIPYISLNNTGINDTGALWLSFILEDHYFPNQLVNDINAAPATSSVDAYRQDAAEGGIDWSGNDGTLGKDGLNLLKKSENVRKQRLHDDPSSHPTGSPATLSIKSAQPGRLSKASVGTRRPSVRSLHTDDGGEHEVSELDSVRRRIQRHVIEDRGIRSVNLWDAALSIIVVSRRIAYITAPAILRVQYSGPCLFDSADYAAKKDEGRTQRLDSAVTIDEGSSTTKASDSTPSSSAATTINCTLGKSYAATLASMARPENAITDATNTPATPKRIFKPHRKGAFSEGSDMQGLSKRLSSITMEPTDHRPERFLEWQKAKQEREGSQYRDRTVTSQLPQTIFNRILAFTLCDSHSSNDWILGTQGEILQNRNGDPLDWPGRALLSERQQRQAYDWGQKSETLVYEREWARMISSSQLWMLMDGVGCLAYEADK